jgi:hypothetical protein
MPDRDNQTAPIPDLNHHIGEGNLLDPTPLPFHNHDVIQPDRLRQDNLQSGQDRGNRPRYCWIAGCIIKAYDGPDPSQQISIAGK